MKSKLAIRSNEIYKFLVIIIVQPVIAVGPCDGSVENLSSSERRKSTIEFKAINEKRDTLQCYWEIIGVPSQPLVLTVKHLTMAYCSQTTFTVYDGFIEDPDKSFYDVCENVTGKTIQSNSGSALIKLVSAVGSFPFTFEISYISSLQVYEPFDTENRGNIGVILAIVLGIVSCGLVVIGLTWFVVKRYHAKYKTRDTVALQLRVVDNQHEDRIFERTSANEVITPSRMIHVASTDQIIQNDFL